MTDPGGPAIDGPGTGPEFRLSYRKLHSDRPGPAPLGKLFFLHGFFGSGRNWSAVARGVVRARPDWEAVLVDLRLHGDSRGAPPPHSVAACALDVERLAGALRSGSGPTAILGHSFGGKVAILAAAEPGLSSEQVWVIDSTPAPGVTGAGAQRLLELVESLPPEFEDRKSGADAVEEAGFHRFIAEWMATNLVRRDGRYRWRFDVNEMRQLLTDFYRSDLWEIVEHPPSETEIHFVRASSDSILADPDAGRIARLESEGSPVHLHTLEGGHWLNVDNPAGLITLLRTRLPRT